MLHLTKIALFSTLCGLVLSELSYKPILEKCEIVDFNKDMIKDFTMDCVTGEKFKLSSNGELLKTLNLDTVKASAQVYIFENGEYVIQPNLKITLGVCNEYKMETFGAWKEIEQYGNFKGCGVFQPGKYYVKDFPPKIKMLDVPIPAARYKINVKFHQDDLQLFEINILSEIKNA